MTDRDQHAPDLDGQAGETTDRDAPDTAAEVDPDVARLLGLRPVDAGAIPGADEVDTLGEITDTRIYQGDLEARPPDSDQPDETEAENLEFLTATELREGETDDPNEAAEEGLTWIPPTDPPVRANAEGDAEVAAGFGTTSMDEPFDQDHHAQGLYAVDEVEARVLDALRADASTVGLAEGLSIDVEGGHVVIAGAVEDLHDEDAVVAVAESVEGVREVESRLEVRSVTEGAPAPADRRSAR
jgi:hypothetical protein